MKMIRIKIVPFSKQMMYFKISLCRNFVWDDKTTRLLKYEYKTFNEIKNLKYEHKCFNYLKTNKERFNCLQCE